MLLPPDPAGSLPPTPTYSSAMSASLSGDGKRSMRRKDFQYKHGQRHHSYDKEKAPYPLSYDKHVLELESLDNRLVQYLRGSISFANFTESPTRVLDLGCGTGTWVIEAAKQWPDCELVGFDLVDVQIPLRFLDSSIANRIEWKHGNFITTKLPFEDDEFDHVHIQEIATGVPENKWGNLFEEVCRVLRPGGSVEVIEDDATFPTLPRWFTTALRARPLRTNSISYPDGSHPHHRPTSSSTSSTFSSASIPSHDHALLESLHRSVFENRFINTKPSSMLPSYLTTYFRHVTLGPVLNFPMPRYAPMQSLPPQIATSYMVPEQMAELLSPRASTVVVPPSSAAIRPMSFSFSSSISTATTSTAMSTDPSTSPSRPRTASAPFAYNPESSVSSFDLVSKTDSDTRTILDLATMPIKPYMLDNSLNDNESDSISPGSLFPIERLATLAERSLAMHLYRSFQVVLACQEAMWEELKDRIRNRKDELLPFGWDDDEELEELQSRKKFEKLIERYRTDMYARISLWSSLDGIGWPIPPREPLSKAELIEEGRLRESMIEARKQATAEEMDTPCRSVRAIVGYKL